MGVPAWRGLPALLVVAAAAAAAASLDSVSVEADGEVRPPTSDVDEALDDELAATEELIAALQRKRALLERRRAKDAAAVPAATPAAAPTPQLAPSPNVPQAPIAGDVNHQEWLRNSVFEQYMVPRVSHETSGGRVAAVLPYAWKPEPRPRGGKSPAAAPAAASPGRLLLHVGADGTVVALGNGAAGTGGTRLPILTTEAAGSAAASSPAVTAAALGFLQEGTLAVARADGTVRLYDLAVFDAVSRGGQRLSKAGHGAPLLQRASLTDVAIAIASNGSDCLRRTGSDTCFTPGNAAAGAAAAGDDAAAGLLVMLPRCTLDLQSATDSSDADDATASGKHEIVMALLLHSTGPGDAANVVYAGTSAGRLLAFDRSCKLVATVYPAAGAPKVPSEPSADVEEVADAMPQPAPVRHIVRFASLLAFDSGDAVRFLNVHRHALLHTACSVPVGIGSLGAGGPHQGDAVVTITSMAFDATTSSHLWIALSSGDILLYQTRLQQHGGSADNQCALAKRLPPAWTAAGDAGAASASTCLVPMKGYLLAASSTGIAAFNISRAYGHQDTQPTLVFARPWKAVSSTAADAARAVLCTVMPAAAGGTPLQHASNAAAGRGAAGGRGKAIPPHDRAPAAVAASFEAVVHLAGISRGLTLSFDTLFPQPVPAGGDWPADILGWLRVPLLVGGILFAVAWHYNGSKADGRGGGRRRGLLASLAHAARALLLRSPLKTLVGANDDGADDRFDDEDDASASTLRGFLDENGDVTSSALNRFVMRNARRRGDEGDADRGRGALLPLPGETVEDMLERLVRESRGRQHASVERSARDFEGGHTASDAGGRGGIAAALRRHGVSGAVRRHGGHLGESDSDDYSDDGGADDDPQARFDAALHQAQEHGRRLGAPQAAARARVLAQQAGGRAADDKRVRFGVDGRRGDISDAAAHSSVDEEDGYGDALVDSLLEMEAAGDDYEGLLVGRGAAAGGGGQRSNRVQALARAAARRTGWHAQAAAQPPSGARVQGGGSTASRGTSGPARWASTIASLAPHDQDGAVLASDSVDERDDAVAGTSDSAISSANAAHAESLLQARIAAARAEQPSPSLGLSDAAFSSVLGGVDAASLAAGDASAAEADDGGELMVPRRSAGHRPLPATASPEEVVRASMATEVHRMAQAAAAHVVDPDGDL